MSTESKKDPTPMKPPAPKPCAPSPPFFHALNRFLLALLQERRNLSLSPAYFAKKIAAHPLAPHFGDLSQWLSLHNPEDWPKAQAPSSPAQTLKHCGCGPKGHWSPSGHWITE